jgi:tetratricopeptide (TPR) repeat protein
MEDAGVSKGKRTQIIDPTPARRKHVIEILYRFLEDKASLAELRGIKRDELYQIAEVGYVKFKHGRVDEAEKIYQGLIVLDHRNAYFHAVMGAIHQKRKRMVEAIVEYTQALRLNRKDATSYVNRGEIYLRHKNYRRAAEDFRAAILLDPEGANLWANRARSLVIAIKCSMDADRKGPARRTIRRG